MKNSISIIILSHNQLPELKQCVDAIREHTHAAYRIVILDAGSNDGTHDWICAQSDMDCISVDKEKGVLYSYNQAIERSDPSSDIVLLRGNALVGPYWYKQLKKHLYARTDIASVTVRDVSRHVENTLPPQIGMSINGVICLLNREALNRVGLYDERYSHRPIANDDWAIRFLLQGYRTLICDDIEWKFGERKRRVEQAEYDQISENFRKIYYYNDTVFHKKWGFSATYSLKERTELVSMICPKEQNMHILEVGCACGATLQAIKNRFPDADIYGIEKNALCGNIANQIARVQIGDIETMTMDFDAYYFDTIILGDVLEHLYDPWVAIKKLSQYLKPGGQIVASIPNITHHYVLRTLLQGRFEYHDSGILDRTHVRFFTEYEIVELFKNAGFAVHAITHTDRPSSDDFIIRLKNLLGDDADKCETDVFQYYISAINMKNMLQDTKAHFRTA